MKYAAVVVAWCGWLGVFAGGCSQGKDAEAPSLPIEHFPQEFAKALCDNLGPCCSKASFSYSDSDCRGSATDHFTGVVTENSGRKTKYDADAAGKCLKALRDATANCRDVQGADRDLCNSVFVGSQPLGADCLYYSECVSQYCQTSRSVDTGETTGVCADPSAAWPAHAQEGEACAGNCLAETTSLFDALECSNQGDTACYQADGLYCPFVTATTEDPKPTAVCVLFAKLGEACADRPCLATNCDAEQQVCVERKDSGSCGGNIFCSDGKYCSADPLSTATPGECLPKKPDGYACELDKECQNGNCDAGTTDHRACGPANIATETACKEPF